MTFSRPTPAPWGFGECRLLGPSAVFPSVGTCWASSDDWEAECRPHGLFRTGVLPLERGWGPGVRTEWHKGGVLEGTGGEGTTLRSTLGCLALSGITLTLEKTTALFFRDIAHKAPNYHCIFFMCCG